MFIINHTSIVKKLHKLRKKGIDIKIITDCSTF